MIKKAKKLATLPTLNQKVSLGDLRVHPVVQREFRPKWSADIAANFDESALDSLWVNREGANLYIFDGQHRFEALKIYLGDGWRTIDVPCRVYDNLDHQTLAKLTKIVNTNKAWMPVSKFRNELVAQEPEAVAINKILNSCGLKVREDSRPGTIRAVSALKRVFGWKPNGPTILAWTLGLLTEAWPENANAVHQNLISGVALFFQKHGDECDRTALLHRLQTHESPDRMLGVARAQARMMSVSVPQAMMVIVAKAYNANRRSGKIALAA